MFELNPNKSACLNLFSRSLSTDDHAYLVNRAVALFDAARSRERFARFKRLITRTSSQLRDLNNLPGIQMRAQYYSGVRSVELKKIHGSLGRIGDFDYDFNPLDDRSRDRWQSIAMAYLHNRNLKPVDLIRVGECYFVQDGHHRISVAHALGQLAIDAEVTVWVIPQIPPMLASQQAEPQIQMIQTLS